MLSDDKFKYEKKKIAKMKKKKDENIVHVTHRFLLKNCSIEIVAIALKALHPSTELHK